jgi:predicted Zn finger-like uncharacterized protein
MLIICPSCATTYEVALTRLGAYGRNVRCSRCRTLWHVCGDAGELLLGNAVAAGASRSRRSAAAGRSEEPAWGSEPAGLAARSCREPMAATDAHSPVPPPRTPLAIKAANGTPRRPNPGAGRRIANAALAGVLVALAAALFAWRTAIVGHLPGTASLLAALQVPAHHRGLAIAGVKCSREVEAGTAVLAIEGTINNITGQVMAVPRLRLAVRDSVGHEVYAWTVLPAGTFLAPGGSVPFASRVASPAAAKEVSVRFLRNRDGETR